MAISHPQISVKIGDWTKSRGKYQTFAVLIWEPGKTIDLGAWSLISETVVYLSGVIHISLFLYKNRLMYWST